jgi:hypothetical protein
MCRSFWQRAQEYRVAALYGDYERSAFQADMSPFMIWVLTMP